MLGSSSGVDGRLEASMSMTGFAGRSLDILLTGVMGTAPRRECVGDIASPMALGLQLARL